MSAYGELIMALSDACAEFLEELANSLTEPKVLVRRLLFDVERCKGDGYVYGEIEMLQAACAAVLTAHPGGNWRRARLGSIAKLVTLAEQVRAYHDTPHPRNAAWLGSEQTPLSGLH